MDYLFQEGVPEGFLTDFERSIFLSYKHRQLQSSEGWCSFAILNTAEKKIVAEVHFHIETAEARSPFQSPFGSFVFSQHVSSEVLNEFVNFTERKLMEKGVKTILLKNPPEAYNQKDIERLQNILLSSGYKMEVEELSAIVSVGNQSFDSILHRSHKKKLRKCYEGDLSFQFLSMEYLEEIYSLLEVIRKEKKYSLSMSLQALKKVTKEFPNHFLLSAVKDDHKIVAANISIRVNSKVLYNFYHDHLQAYDSVSPVVLLNEGLYHYCQREGIALLDLGTSTLEGKINVPLLEFKVRLGAKPSRKLTFTKNLL